MTSRPDGGRRMRYMGALPAIVILTPAVISLLAWLGPIAPGGLSGYHFRADVSAWGVALVVAWYGALVAVAQFAFHRGRRRGPLQSLERVSSREVHLWTCGIGVFGTAWAYWVATDGSASKLLDLWRTQQFNTLRRGFEYGVGVPTLRYAIIVAGALTIVHLIRRGRIRPLDILSLVGLLAASALASRLSLVAAIVIAVTILLASRAFNRPRWSTVLVSLLAGLLVFTALNYSRSANTYREAGVTNPFEMAALNAQAYLAAPTQVTLGFATVVMDGDYSPSTSITDGARVLLPTYADVPVQRSTRRDAISSMVEVSPDLTTNGALPGVLLGSGWIALGSALAAVGLAAWATGRMLLSAEIGPAIGGVLLYGMAELWRLLLLNQGIFHFLVLIGILALIVGKLREPAASHRRLARWN